MNDQALAIDSLISEPEEVESSFKVVSLPVDLIRFKDAIGIGLYAYALEKFEITSINNNVTRKKTRIELSGIAIEILNKAVKPSHSTNDTPYQICDVIYSVLLWLKDQPSHILQTKL